MKKVRTGVSIDAPRDRVFEMFTDFQSLGDVVSAITKFEVVTDGPIGEGTRVRETRKMFGKEHTEEMWITEFSPGESYCLEAESCGAHYTTLHVFSDEGAGTRVDIEWSTRPVTTLSRLVTPLLNRLMSKSFVKMFLKDLEEMKAAAEGGSAEPALA